MLMVSQPLRITWGIGCGSVGDPSPSPAHPQHSALTPSKAGSQGTKAEIPPARRQTSQLCLAPSTSCWKPALAQVNSHTCNKVAFHHSYQEPISRGSTRSLNSAVYSCQFICPACWGGCSVGTGTCSDKPHPRAPFPTGSFVEYKDTGTPPPIGLRLGDLQGTCPTLASSTVVQLFSA